MKAFPCHDIQIWILSIILYLRGLFLDGFVVTNVGTSPTAERLDLLFAQAQVHCDSKPQQIGLNHDYELHFWFHAMNVSILHLKMNMVHKARGILLASPIVKSCNAP